MNLKGIDSIRRTILYLLFPIYVRNSLGKRKGECKNCGKCCGDCTCMDENNRCKIYNTRPEIFCLKEFPIDRLQLKLWGIKDCGYYWDKEENK